MRLILFVIVELFFLQTTFAETLQVGKFEPEEWLANVSSETYEYAPDSLIVSDIKSTLDQDLTMIVFAASWCGDSKSEVPKMIKIMELINPVNVVYYNLNRDKLEPSGIAQENKIERVPTLIIKRNKQELGRIVEYPDSTIEYDINEILKLKCFK